MVSWMVWRGRIPLTVLACLALTASASAESDDTGALRREVGELGQAVERLDARVKNLEQHCSGESGPSAQETGKIPQPVERAGAAREVGLKDHWQSVKLGMTMQQIEALVGRPDRIVKLSSKNVWYYSYPDVGNGSVVFAEDGTVIDLQTPPFNTWWGF
ncbi:MAG: outer membrane protein assembly factor BamE [Candidatus Binatia bacterium]